MQKWGRPLVCGWPPGQPARLYADPEAPNQRNLPVEDLTHA